MVREEKHRVGLMGGTFDPIHIGHLLLAECAYGQFTLEKVLFLPAGNPPHKPGRKGGATDLQRLEMVRLAIQGNPHFGLETEEMNREGYTYTKDTLKILKEKQPDTEFYFIIGADSLMTFDTWREPEEICQNCTLAVAVRDQLDRDTIHQKMEVLKEQYDARIHLLQTPDVEISSSNLRHWHKKGQSIRYYVPDAVLEYIENNGIYRG